MVIHLFYCHHTLTLLISFAMRNALSTATLSLSNSMSPVGRLQVIYPPTEDRVLKRSKPRLLAMPLLLCCCWVQEVLPSQRMRETSKKKVACPAEATPPSSMYVVMYRTIGSTVPLLSSSVSRSRDSDTLRMVDSIDRLDLDNAPAITATPRLKMF